MPLGMEIGLSPGDFVLDGDPAPIRQKGQSPSIFGPRLLWQKAAWIKMPVGTEVGLVLRNVVLDGDPAPPRLQGHGRPIFGQCPLWPNGWMD